MEAFLAHHHAGDVGPPPAWGGVADDGPDAPCAVAGMFGKFCFTSNTARGQQYWLALHAMFLGDIMVLEWDSK